MFGVQFGRLPPDSLRDRLLPRGLVPIPQNCGRDCFFSQRPRDLPVCLPEAFAPSLLCETNFFFFSSRKAAKTCPPRRAQRNTGRPTAGRLTEKEKYPFFAPAPQYCWGLPCFAAWRLCALNIFFTLAKEY